MSLFKKRRPDWIADLERGQDRSNPEIGEIATREQEDILRARAQMWETGVGEAVEQVLTEVPSADVSDVPTPAAQVQPAESIRQPSSAPTSSRVAKAKAAVKTVRGFSTTQRRILMVLTIGVLGMCVVGLLLLRTPTEVSAPPTLEQMGGQNNGQPTEQAGQPDFDFPGGVQVVQPTQPAAQQGGDGIPNFGVPPVANTPIPAQPIQQVGQTVNLTLTFPGFDAAGGVGIYDWLATKPGMPADASLSTGSFACTFLAEVKGKGIVDQYKASPNSPLTFSITAIHPAGCQR